MHNCCYKLLHYTFLTAFTHFCAIKKVALSSKLSLCLWDYDSSEAAVTSGPADY